MVSDVHQVVRTCEGYQYYAHQTHLPTQALQTIPITWPFTVWDLDLVGPHKKALGGYTHILAIIDNFNKWIEAWPITKITSDQAIKFITNIIHRFWYPNQSSWTMTHSLPGADSWNFAMNTIFM